MKSINMIRRAWLITALLALSIIYSAAVSSIMVSANEYDGYTMIDWDGNRDIETTDNNSVLMGQDFLFWRYVDMDNPESGAVWKSTYGDSLTDEEVRILLNEGEHSQFAANKYFRITMDVDSIPDENIRNYIYNHVDEWVPDLKLKFDIESTLGGRNNTHKASRYFRDNGEAGYRVFRDANGICKLEMKFRPNFHLYDLDLYSEEGWLPYMPSVNGGHLQRAMYPFSSVVFSMWSNNPNNNTHYGSLEVIEGDDPRYIYGQSFGYGDILEKGKIPENMIYPNFEAGKINEEGSTAGQREDDTLDSNLIRIGQQYKKRGDLWYYSYGGAVGYLFKFPVRVTFELNEQAHITKRFIDTSTGEVITSELVTLPFDDRDSLTASFMLADRSGNAIIDGTDDKYIYQYYEIKTSDETVKDTSSNPSVAIEVDRTEKDKILDIYVTKLPVVSKLIVRYVDDRGNELKSEEITGPTLTTADDEDVIDYHIDPPPGKSIRKYVVSLPDESIENEVNNPSNLDVQIPVTPKAPYKIITIHCENSSGSNGGSNGGGSNDDDPEEIATQPVDPPICDKKTNTITWQETEQHKVVDSDGNSHRCTHTYTYVAALKVDSINITPDTLKSGYGVNVDVSTSVSYHQTGQKRSRSYCSKRLSSSRTPTNKPTPPTKVVARLGWKTSTFSGTFIQDSSVTLERLSRTSTKATFTAPKNNVVGENKIYTDIYLSGTGELPRKHKIAFDTYGGGVNGTAWCTTVEKIITINGDMYEDAGTTST